MWNISKITEDLYCFTANSTNGEEQIAIVSMKALNNQLAMNIHCQGISCFDGEDLFPTVQECNGLMVIDTTFYEEIT